MTEYLTNDLIQGLIAFQVVLLLVVLSNRYLLRRSRQHATLRQHLPVSILIPARNEEQNIDCCVRSLLAQDYPSFEILVLDDQSSDATPAILQEIAAAEPRLRVLKGQALPEGWLGKNWACAQLAEQARGELLLFTDADTFHQARTLTALVTCLDGEQADLLTGFPSQELRSWGEQLIVPFFSWAFYSFTPLALAYRLKLSFLSSGVGQMLLFRRLAYQAVGGHAAVRDQIAEDLVLTRQIKAAGLRWRICHVTDLISSRMYDGARQAFEGFSKNYFAAFGFRVLPYLFVFSWLAVIFWLPPVVLGLSLFGLAPLAQPAALAACIVLSLLLWAIPLRELGFDLRLALLYPIIILVTEAIAFQSLRLSLTGQIRWKSRALDRPRWKWL